MGISLLALPVLGVRTTRRVSRPGSTGRAALDRAACASRMIIVPWTRMRCQARPMLLPTGACSGAELHGTGRGLHVEGDGHPRRALVAGQDEDQLAGTFVRPDEVQAGPRHQVTLPV